MEKEIDFDLMRASGVVVNRKPDVSYIEAIKAAVKAQSS